MKYLLTTLFVFSLTVSIAQNASSEIEKTFTQMNQALVDKDFEGMMEYMAEELFEAVPKQQMIDVLGMMMNNPQLEFVLTVPEVLSVGAVEEVEGKHYAIVESKGQQKMRFFDESGNPMKMGDSPMVAQTYEQMKAQAGEENIQYDEESGFFIITSNQKSIAISEDGSSNWKFLQTDANMKAIVANIVPAKILE